MYKQYQNIYNICTKDITKDTSRRDRRARPAQPGPEAPSRGPPAGIFCYILCKYLRYIFIYFIYVFVIFLSYFEVWGLEPGTAYLVLLSNVEQQDMNTRMTST